MGLTDMFLGDLQTFYVERTLNKQMEVETYTLLPQKEIFQS